MFLEFMELRRGGEPLYVQMYTQIKGEIERGALKQGEKLPSIRNLSEDFQVSKTTVQTAYDQLTVEGYIENKPKRGYFVLAQAPLPKKGEVQRSVHMAQGTAPSEVATPYNFSSNEVDRGSMDTKRWRSLMKEALLQEDILASYGDPQGQPQLRSALSRYGLATRGVRATEEQIVIGAGVTPLLHMLCGLLHDHADVIGVESGGFPTAEQVFYDSRVQVAPLKSDDMGITVASLETTRPGAVLLTPSKASDTLPAMPLNRRIELLKYAYKKGIYLLEDDYNGELRFLAKPIPSLQSIDKNNQVVYIGSFSKLLLPSVRISYMVLPQPLLAEYTKVSYRYNQTASKVEQMALAAYLDDGSMQKHIRKLRKVYSEKAKILMGELHSAFGELARVTLQETALRVVVQVQTKLDAKAFERAAQEAGLHIKKGSTREGAGSLTLLLGFSAIEREHIAPGVHLLEKVLKSD